MQEYRLKPQLSQLPGMLQEMKAFYIYEHEGLPKALQLYPATKAFIELNAERSFEQVKRDLIKEMLKIDTSIVRA